MAANTSIEWTDRTWNPVRGCTRVSPGCGGPGPFGGCYAERMASRFAGPGKPYEGLVAMKGGKPRWTGKITFGHDLDAPLRWRKPQRIFVNSMSDLFHEGLSREEIATVYAVCVAAHLVRGHVSQILTKRSARMRAVLTDPAFWEQVNAEVEMHLMEHVDPLNRRSDDARAMAEEYGPANPPPGVWLGVSAEDQRRADERVPDLLATPAAVRFVSAEPLLGPIDFTAIRWPDGSTFDALDGWQSGDPSASLPSLSGIFVGGESGPGARPMHPDWARQIRDACAAVGTAFLFKQWGEWAPYDRSRIDGAMLAVPNSFDEPLQKVGKKLAGRLLDGKLHDAMPEVHHG